MRLAATQVCHKQRPNDHPFGEGIAPDWNVANTRTSASIAVLEGMHCELETWRHAL